MDKLELIQKIIEDAGITCGESLYQVDKVATEMPEILLQICQIIYDNPEF